MAKVTIERLRQIPLTEKLTKEQVESLLPRVQELLLSQGETLFSQGEPATHLFFVEKGGISEIEEVAPGQQKLHRHAGEGECLGRYGLVTGRPFRVTATADEDTVLLAIPLRHLQPILFSYPDWRSWFFRTESAARMRAMPLFRDFGDWDIYRLADQVDVQEYTEGTTIFPAGSPADSFFVIDQGQVVETPGLRMQPPGDWPRYLAAGNFVGEASLTPDQSYETTAIARKASRLYRIPGHALRELLADRGVDPSTGLRRTDIVKRLRGVPPFSNLPDRQLQLLAGYTSLVFRQPGDIVARQGEPATALMILDEGEAIVRRQIGDERPRPVRYFKAHRKESQVSAQLGRPESDHFGAHALLAAEMRGATVEVTESSTWIVLERADFQRFLADAGLTQKDLKQDSPPEEQVASPLPSEPGQLSLLYRTRRHWIVAVRGLLPVAVPLLLVAVLVLADVAILKLSAGLRNFLLPVGLGTLGLLGLWSLWRYLDWRNDFYEVTNQAVVHIEKVILIREERYEAPLEQIQNVNIQVGIWGRLLGYGDLSIDTAAVKGQVEFTWVPKPADVQRLIQRAAEQARSGRRIQFRESIRQQLEDQLNPERLRPAMPASVLIQPGPSPPSPSLRSRLRSPRLWHPRFEIREPDRITWRKHWLNLLQRAGMPAMAALVTTYLLFAQLLAYVTRAFGSSPPVQLPPVSWLGLQGWLFLVTAVLWIASVLWLIYQYVDWRNDIYVVTDDEVIDVERELAFFPLWFIYTESRRQASLDKVQYVDFKIPNLWAVMLNYGDVIVQTAGIEGTLDFLFVSNPRRVQAEILRRLAAFRERQRQREFEERWGDMAEWFEAYRDLAE